MWRTGRKRKGKPSVFSLFLISFLIPAPQHWHSLGVHFLILSFSNHHIQKERKRKSKKLEKHEQREGGYAVLKRWRPFKQLTRGRLGPPGGSSLDGSANVRRQGLLGGNRPRGCMLGLHVVWTLSLTDSRPLWGEQLILPPLLPQCFPFTTVPGMVPGWMTVAEPSKARSPLT